MIRRFVVTFVVSVVACGGAIATDAVDGGTSSSSSSSSGTAGRPVGTSSSSSGKPTLPISAGVIECPDAFDVCGSETGSATPTACCVEGNAYSCTSLDDIGDCYGSTLECDEGPDCKTGVCCAEYADDSPISSRRPIRTTCRSTCITNAPRVKVCRTQADCDDGSICKDWSCPGLDTPGVMTCGALEPCD